MAKDNSTSDAMSHIWQRAIASVDRKLDTAKLGALTAPSSLIDRWIEVQSNPAFPLRPTRRAPASSDDIEAVESRLGFSLPAQVRELYESTNGLDWVASKGQPMACGGYFPSTTHMSLAGDLVIPLSKLTKEAWEELEEPDEPQRVALHGPGALSHMVEEPEIEFSFEDLDSFLALQRPASTDCLVIAHRNGLHVPEGTVLEIESLIATRYDSLSHWLLAQIGIFGG